ncbi:neural cell adhesion molecule 1-like [Rhipicephalus microplus]|uniref:neural cell adhesion molecule 1-like n=1 Tax=Rhipicephalus microplus TaxID=6941 RepID=UPI003F6BF8D1
MRTQTMILIYAIISVATITGFAASSDQPHVQPFSFPQNVNLGEEASVACVVTRGSKPLSIVWTQDGRPVSNGDRKFAKTVLDNFVTLTIRRVTAEDVGNYTCTVTNDFGTDSAAATLLVEGEKAGIVHGPPEIMPFSFSKNVVLGQKTTVTCVVSSGTGPYRFEWKHGERRVAGDGRRHVQNFADNVGALTIEAIAAEDLGNYTCTVGNSVGSANYSATLVVEGEPVS